MSGSVPPPPSPYPYCRFYAKGRCARAGRCPFSHGDADAGEKWLARAESWLLVRPEAAKGRATSLPDLLAAIPLPAPAGAGAAAMWLRKDARFVAAATGAHGDEVADGWMAAAWAPPAAAPAAPAAAGAGGRRASGEEVGGGHFSARGGGRSLSKSEQTRAAEAAAGPAPSLQAWATRVHAYVEVLTRPPLLYWGWTLPRLLRDGGWRASLAERRRLLTTATRYSTLPPRLRSLAVCSAACRGAAPARPRIPRGGCALCGGGVVPVWPV